MRISFEWIKDFVDISASAEEAAHRLTMSGLEIEGWRLSTAMVMEVNVTPNRPDCLNVLGTAREVAAAFGLPLKNRRPASGAPLEKGDIRVEIDATDLCGRYTGRLIKGVTVGESPDWMKKRLEKCGIRAINNVVDITNYILLECGHPLHAFDADRIADRVVRIAKAGKNRSIRTLDGVERRLSEDTLLIWDGREPVAVAGIMGGERSSVDASTRNIFLESAYFDPSSIRRSSRDLGLKSESSYRFERGTDREFLETALNRASLLIQEIAGGMIHEIVDLYPGKYVPIAVEVPYHRVNSCSARTLKKKNAQHSRNDRITTSDRKFIHRLSSAFRGDIKEPVDIIEEIARCYIYGRSRSPCGNTSAGRHPEQKKILIRSGKRSGSGFTEVINYNFMNPETWICSFFLQTIRGGVRSPEESLRREDS
jgi:phenylalanyl-tRNA synthetase beta chain